MRRWVERTSAVLGGRVVLACVLLAVAGAFELLRAATAEARPAVWGAFIASWLFFAGAAMGLVAFRAALDLTGARWADSLLPVVRIAPALAVTAAALLALLLAGLPAWVPALDEMVAARRPWLAPPFFIAREAAASAALFALAVAYVRRARTSASAPAAHSTSRMAFAFCVLYAVALSFWAFDFVLGLDREWVSTLLGAHLFMGALLSGIALLTIVGVLSGRTSADQRHDLGKLLFGFSIFWAYLLWSQYLPIWYANLPEETGFIVRRTQAPWSFIALAVVSLTFVVPFVGLFREQAKRSPRVLGSIAGCELLGLWLERHLLVAPSFPAGPSGQAVLPSILVSLGALGIFVLALAHGSLAVKRASDGVASDTTPRLSPDLKPRIRRTSV